MAGYGEDEYGEMITLGAEELGHRNPKVNLRMHRPTEGRRLPLGIQSSNPLLMPAGAGQDVTTRPQLPFRFERFVVPSDIASFFTINDIKVGNISVFAAIGPVPARTFSEDATNVLLGTDTNQPATDLTASVVNISGAPQIFRGTFIGVAVK